MKRRDDGEAWTRRDPERVFERRQRDGEPERTCEGCRHIVQSPKGGPEVACERRMRPPKKDIDATRRCDYHAPWPEKKR